MNKILNDLKAFIPHCMIKDRHRLSRAFDEIERQWQRDQKNSQSDDQLYKKIDSLHSSIESAIQVVEERKSYLPELTFPEALPVSQKWKEIASLIEKNQVVVIAGETGSGKTTQLPKICMALGRGVTGMIGHTQPRRLAARAVSSRIAEECGSQVGELIGFKVRFGDQVSSKSLVKLMTDGILLAEMQGDRFLSQYDTIIIDEAHERSLNIDFILGYLKQLLPKRPDLKVIITSATIDVNRFSKHFNDAPVIEVTGRMFPVNVFYRPWQLMGEEGDEVNLYSAIAQVVEEIEAVERQDKSAQGDILVFLPGEREIRDLAHDLKDRALRNTEVVPLYARLNNTEQAKIFKSHTGRRIVLSTNVAETSLTVPGIRYVIDTGVARISRYSYRTKIQRLPVEAISQSSANQRKGRCGRVSEGVCFRMYSEEDFLARPEFTEPEILRTNLASVILKMETLKLGSLDHFPFLDKPDSRLINDGYKLLFELQGVDEKRRLTKVGELIAKAPVDPKLARMIVEAKKEQSLREILIIISGLSIQDPRERPADKMQAADQVHAVYKDEQSDFLSWVNLWDSFEVQRQALSGNQLQKYCRKHLLSYMRMREWRDLHRQLHLLMKDVGYKENTEAAGYPAVHRALLSGLLGGIAMKDEKRIYNGGRNRQLNLFPGSVLYKKPPLWMVSAEIVETTKVYARMNAQIDPLWVEALGKHLIKQNWSEPHWEKKRGQVVAFERVSLYGLDIIAKRKVNYSQIDPKLCRELFIRQALVEGEFQSKAPFLDQNRKTIERIHDMEAKVRRRDILIEDEALFEFYDEHLPQEIVSARHFEHWWKKAPPKSLDGLLLTADRLMAKQADSINEANYPDYIETHGLRLPLQYHFEPGQKHDGVTLKVPVSALKQVSAAQLEWMVPGLVREKCIQLIKHLPRTLRKHFVPVPNFVDDLLPRLNPSANTPLTESLSQALLRKTAIRLPPEAWEQSKLDDYLSFNIQVVDSQGKILDESRHLDALLETFSGGNWSDNHHFDEVLPEVESFTTWENLNLPEEITVKQAGVEMRLYPALKDCTDHVEVIRCNDSVTAASLHEKGAARLLCFKTAPLLKNIDRLLPNFKKAALLYAPLGRSEQLLDDLCMSAVQHCFLSEGVLPRSTEAFNQNYEAKRAELISICEAQSARLFAVMQVYNKIMKKLKGKLSFELATPMADLKFQLQQLVSPGFLAQTPVSWLNEFPRYLNACEVRLEKMPRNLAFERVWVPQLKEAWEKFSIEKEQLEKRGAENPALYDYRWMLEEWRVSLYAQQLGTLIPVSDKRIAKQWKTVKGQ